MGSFSGQEARSVILGAAAATLFLSTIILLKCSILPSCCSKNKKNKNQDLSKISFLKPIADEFTISAEKLNELSKVFVEDMKTGLCENDHSLKMLPAFIEPLPTGSETGTFLSMDVGGTNLRVFLVTLEGHGRVSQRHKTYFITEELKTGTGRKLFDFMADCIADFLIMIHGHANGHYELGFTFSFPIDQRKINHGVLILWNKGFSAEGVVGEDVVELLHKACRRKNINIHVAILTNDAVSTMVAHSYKDPHCRIGVIIGTGTNASYMELISEIKKLNPQPAKVTKGNVFSPRMMAINLEWGNFDEERRVLPITRFDDELDRSTRSCGRQYFEKLISGLFLGDLVRIIILHLAKQGHLFRGLITELMNISEQFTTAHMTIVESDESDNLKTVGKLLKSIFQVSHTSFKDRLAVKHICILVSTRSARLSAMAICSVIAKIHAWPACTVAIDGSVFEKYPHYEKRQREALKELIGQLSENVHLVGSKDSSGIGSALCAAIASQKVGESYEFV